MLQVMTKSVLVFLLLLSTVSAGEVSSVVALFDRETSEQVEQLLENRATLSVTMLGVSRLLSHDEISNLYARRAFMPVWFDGWQLKPEATILLENLRNAGAQGLCSNDYLLPELERLMSIQIDFTAKNLPLSADNRAVLDLLLSQSFLTYATHMVEGQVDPSLAHVDWKARRRKVDLVKLLEYAIENQRLSQVIENLAPPHEEYVQLMKALSDYQRISAGGGWPKIPAGPTIRPGQSDERIPLLKMLLSLTGDLAIPGDGQQTYDAETSAAMRRFQSRHGLADDGVVGRKTLEALNVPVEERIRQIELNLERWRWMPKSFGARHIRVNIADFSLEVVEDGEAVMRMSVIVGTQYRKTPVFSAQMTYLEFAPYWTVPPTILREDKLPQIKLNPAYLADKHFRIIARAGDQEVIDPWQIDWTKVTASNFPGLLRMDPGPWNPLGRVKFMFPNQFNVYLHDTNEVYLFDKHIRSFSSGCIRVERPRELASYLLEKKIGRKRLQQLFMATAPVQVPIDPLPVHIQYWTAWVDHDGLVQFRPDVYFRDLDLDIALTEPAYRVMDQL
jgi:murein L,D-transpeptidase YcbB/YkuD